MANRLVASARGILNPLLPDIYIYTDVYRGEDSGKSPGFALTLLASTTSTALHSAEATSCLTSASAQASPPSPEDVGVAAARALLAEISRGGCIDHGFEWIACLFLALAGENDVGRIKIGGLLDPSFVGFIRDLRDVLGVTAKLKALPLDLARQPAASPGPTDQLDEFIVSIVGLGFTNSARGAR